METLHKLAGVQDASDLHSSSNERPSQPHVLPPQPPPPSSIPDSANDPEAQQNGGTLSRRASRASLPLNRQPSHKSFRSSKHQLSRSHSRSSAVGAPDDYPPVPLLKDPTEAGATSSSSGGLGGEPSPHAQSPTYALPPPRTSHDTSAAASSSATEDFAWGPSHPCFPHPNPHCAPDSPEYHATRVIRVRRDWLASGDLYPQFANLYPEILDPLVTDSEFRLLVSTLNAKLKAAFDPFSTRAWMDSLMGAATGYLWEDLGMTRVKRGMKGLERWLEEWNQGKKGQGTAVRVVQGWEVGFMGLDFVVPDPGIEGDGVGVGDEEMEE
ncbi:hypothetical protein B0A55_07643 [Friedmanniomyces simplex]|uniref:Ras modification protein ERF4 n=1 Tax=Friedmanniomyces simplex TaxID=329884 RepID=A0A4U0X297_9PEZI|nr:hypothetical protein B0A55_07643 [Friedmanniomyces simplex]